METSAWKGSYFGVIKGNKSHIFGVASWTGSIGTCGRLIIRYYVRVVKNSYAAAHLGSRSFSAIPNQNSNVTERVRKYLLALDRL